MATVNEIVQESLVQMPESVASLIVRYSRKIHPICDSLRGSFVECDGCKQLVYIRHLYYAWLPDFRNVVMCRRCMYLNNL
jgi:hypothetical protein